MEYELQIWQKPFPKKLVSEFWTVNVAIQILRCYGHFLKGSAPPSLLPGVRQANWIYLAYGAYCYFSSEKTLY